MKLKTDIISQYKVCFISLLSVSFLFASFEITAILSTLVVLFVLAQKKIKFSKNFLFLISLLIIISTIAIITGLVKNEFGYDFLKDFFYLNKPILLILAGYAIVRKINNQEFLYKTIVSVAVFFAAIHLFLVAQYVIAEPDFTVAGIRYYAGRDSILELFALSFLVANIRLKKIKFKHQNLITLVLALSFLFYLSRTMTLVFIFMLIAFLGYLKLTTKGLRYILFTTLIISALYAYLFSVKIDRDSSRPIDNFLYKLKIAPAEIFIKPGSLDVKDHANLWDHWRAYEASKAIGALNDGKTIDWFFGLGMGSLIDLDFYAPLSDDDKGMRFISLLHNGYVYVLYKTGFIGLLIYILFFVFIIVPFNSTKEMLPSYNILVGIVTFYIISSFVISGLYNLSDPISLLVGAFFKQREIEFYENSNYRY
jgi:O-antigen ligase